MEYKTLSLICKNPWCKAPYKHKMKIEIEEVNSDNVDPDNLNESIDNLVNDIKSNRKKEKENKEETERMPDTCPKCRSFDKELSGGVSWKEKKYSGSRHDGKAHEVGFKFSKYKRGKGFWS